MKKKDQESLRKIVIIGLVLVVGYLGYQSMTSGSSPFSEASEPTVPGGYECKVDKDCYGKTGSSEYVCNNINERSLKQPICKSNVCETKFQLIEDCAKKERGYCFSALDRNENPTAECKVLPEELGDRECITKKDCSQTQQFCDGDILKWEGLEKCTDYKCVFSEIGVEQIDCTAQNKICVKKQSEDYGNVLGSCEDEFPERNEPPIVDLPVDGPAQEGENECELDSDCSRTPGSRCDVSNNIVMENNHVPCNNGICKPTTSTIGSCDDFNSFCLDTDKFGGINMGICFPNDDRDLDFIDSYLPNTN